MTNRFVTLGALAACAVAAAAGCATTSPVIYASIIAPPRPFVRRAPADVDVFVGKPPARPSVDVGLFEIYQALNDDGTLKSTEAMIAMLRVHAALRGCDAVQLLGIERGTWCVVRGVCEMYNDEQARLGANQPRATAPPEPLPGEGKACLPEAMQAGSSLTPESTAFPPCPEPLVCSKKVCASPYL
jgi:hypothetical protein